MKKLLFISVVLFLGTSQIYATDPVACTMEYAPVCGSVQVQCIAAPCDPVKTTFSNTCMANAAHATEITQGESRYSWLYRFCWIYLEFNKKSVYSPLGRSKYDPTTSTSEWNLEDPEP